MSEKFQENKKKYMLTSIMFLTLFFAISIFCPTSIVQAKENYKNIFFKVELKKVVKVNNYYFYYARSKGDSLYNSGFDVYYSDNLSGTYTRKPWGTNIWINGENVYYFYGRWLCSYNLSTNKETVLKTCEELNDTSSYTIKNICDGKVFFEKYVCNWPYFKYKVYCYDMKTKKTTKVANDVIIESASGKWIAATLDCPRDISAKRIYLYKIKGKKIKKVRCLTKTGFSYGFVNGKLYYSVYNNKSIKYTPTLYRCNKNGTHRKKLAKIKKKRVSQILINKIINNTQCIVNILDGSEQWLYNFKKHKWIKRVKESTFVD